MPLGLGLGLGLQKPTPPLVSSWPTIADIPQGAIVLDTDGAVKQKRWVLELNGPDTVSFLPISSDLKNTDWEISVTVKDTNPIQGVYSDIIRTRRDTELGAIIFLLYITPTKKIGLELRNNGTYNAAAVTVKELSQNFEQLRVVKVGTTITLFALGEAISVSINTWSAQTAYISTLSDYTEQSRPLLVSSVRQSLNGISVDCFPCDSASGTVVPNTCTSSRPATLSDANAHAAALVPVSML